MSKRLHEKTSSPLARHWVLLYSGIATAVAIFGTAVIARGFLGRVDEWLLGDWLIDYSAGFSRRGLIGEGVRLFSTFFSLDRLLVTSLLQWGIFISLIAAVTVLFSRHHKGLLSLLMFVSPAFLLYFLNFFGTMRKEMLLLLLVSGVLILSAHTTRVTSALWLLVFAFPLLILAHEAMAFFLGFVLAVFFLLASEGKISSSQAATFAVATLAGSGFSAILSFLAGGSPGIDKKMCNNLVESGYSSQLCGGAITFLDRNPEEAVVRVSEYVVNGNYLSTYVIVLALSAVPFFFVRFSKTLGLIFGLSLAMTIPLFVVAIDWGRWIVISVWLVTLIVLRFDGTKHITVIPLRRNRRLLSAVAISVGIAAFALLWSVPHCCEPRIGFGVFDRVAEVMALLASI